MAIPREEDTFKLVIAGLAMFFSFEEAPSYTNARALAPEAIIIVRTFGGYVAFKSMDAYHCWMISR